MKLLVLSLFLIFSLNSFADDVIENQIETNQNNISQNEIISKYQSINARSIEYADLNKMLNLLKNKAKSRFVKSNIKLEIKNEAIKPESVLLWLANESYSEFNPITVNQDLSVNLPLIDAEKAKKIRLYINQKKDDVALSMGLSVADLETEQVPYADVFLLVEDMNLFIDEMAGGWSVFAPSMDAMAFYFDDKASITIQSNGKEKTFFTDDEFQIEIDYETSWMKENPMMQFSVLPKGMSPID